LNWRQSVPREIPAAAGFPKLAGLTSLQLEISERTKLREERHHRERTERVVVGRHRDERRAEDCAPYLLCHFAKFAD
jgi:hypothetical protein